MDPEQQSDPIKENPEEQQFIDKSDALAKALSTMLGSVIKDFDCKAEETLKSQEHLTSSIDRLTRELDQLLEDAPFPFIIQHAAKISALRKRVFSLNLLLKSIQKRLDNLDRVLFAGRPQGKDNISI
ncbi:uncharacterized protein LOC126671248 [Mercurialis annua]|uniref:uncharacterized protein LOC126671248 n=1 Tax=Mercurialis annua TaxID=3986 RepID=UPI00215EE3CA|nr:uncharacterized protein LOC126671248 [Mercurialis annua]